MSKTPTMRLDRLLSNLGYGSRKEMHGLVAAGQVVLDGAALTDAGARIAIGADLPDRMRIMGKPVDPPPPLVVMMHKPLGVVCSHKEYGDRVYDLLPPRWRVRCRRRRCRADRGQVARPGRAGRQTNQPPRSGPSAGHGRRASRAGAAGCRAGPGEPRPVRC